MVDNARSPAESSGFSKKIAALIIIIYTVVTLIPITWIILTGFKSVTSSITYPPEVFFKPSLSLSSPSKSIILSKLFLISPAIGKVSMLKLSSTIILSIV